jgi:GNAT superfamily N-acetyltransferase
MTDYTRQATEADLPAAMAVLNAGIAYLKAQGSPQWQDGQGPTEEQVLADISAGFGYVLIHEGEVAGYGALIPGPDPIYEHITEGAWSQNGDYVAIHRIAVDTNIRGKGLSKTLFHDLIVLARANDYTDVRVDTFPANEIMQHVIMGAGFQYAGMIQFPFAHGERRAFELLLN